MAGRTGDAIEDAGEGRAATRLLLLLLLLLLLRLVNAVGTERRRRSGVVSRQNQPRFAAAASNCGCVHLVQSARLATRARNMVCILQKQGTRVLGVRGRAHSPAAWCAAPSPRPPLRRHHRRHSTAAVCSPATQGGATVSATEQG